MNRNVTFTLDEEILKKARIIAVKMNRSLTQIIREYLEEMVRRYDERAQILVRVEELLEEKPLHVGKRSWTREEIYEE